MTLDEAIKHCEEKAEELKKQADDFHTKMDGVNAVDCFGCAKEHEQLAEWLKQLREVKKIVDEFDIETFPILSMEAYYFERIVEVFKEVKKNEIR